MELEEFREVLRSVLSEELGLGEVELAEKWRGGSVIIEPGREGTQAKSLGIDTFFRKIIMVRDKLRLLEQKVNAHSQLPEDEKVQLQQYITAAYGSLTSFNFLFKERKDGFVGTGGGE